MEQFTRECLEIGTEETPSQGVLKTGSMDRVYERAAKLVKKTLDVEGATVMDVSHFDVLETTKGEGAISIVCHHGDTLEGEGKGTNTTTHSHLLCIYHHHIIGIVFLLPATSTPVTSTSASATPATSTLPT